MTITILTLHTRLKLNEKNLVAFSSQDRQTDRSYFFSFFYCNDITETIKTKTGKGSVSVKPTQNSIFQNVGFNLPLFLAMRFSIIFTQLMVRINAATFGFDFSYLCL